MSAERSRHRSYGGALFWLIMLCVLVAVAYAAYRWLPRFWEAKPTAAPAVRSTPVIAATAKRGDLPIYLVGLGTVTPENSVTVRTRIDGKIDHIHFTEGKVVNKGDLLVEIDPQPYQVQLTQAQGQQKKDEAALANARIDLKRYQDAGNAISDQIRKTAEALVTQDEGTILTDKGQVDAAKLQISYCSIVAPISGVIGLRMIDEGNMVHAADANGLVVINQIQPISLIFSLSEDSLPQVLAARAHGEVLPVEARNRDGTVKLATGKLAAVDNQIDPTTAMAKFKAEFDNNDPAHMLFPNQFVNIHLLVDTRKNVVLVPSAAVQQSPQGAYVYVVKPGANKGPANSSSSPAQEKPAPSEAMAKESESKPPAASQPKPPAIEGKVQVRYIKTGPDEGDLTSIRQGLEAGEIVVTDGIDKLQDGSSVSVTMGGDAPATQPASAPATRSSP